MKSNNKENIFWSKIFSAIILFIMVVWWFYFYLYIYWNNQSIKTEITTFNKEFNSINNNYNYVSNKNEIENKERNTQLKEILISKHYQKELKKEKEEIEELKLKLKIKELKLKKSENYIKELENLLNQKNSKIEIKDKKEIVEYSNKIAINNEKNIIQKDISKIKIPKQWYNTNTCVIDNLDFILEYTKNKKLNKSLIYKSMWKKIWDYWTSWLLIQWKYWGIIKETNEHKDYKKFSEITNINFHTSSNLWLFKEQLKSKNTAYIMEIPMYLIDKDKKWLKEENQSIFHAISIIWYLEETNKIKYINTLNWKIEYMDLKYLISSNNENYLKYPYKWIIWENKDYNKTFLL